VKTDRQLITQAQRGDAHALNQLFTQWYRPVYNIAYRYFSDAERAGDVSQQVFLVIQEKLGQLRDPDAFRVWLYRTVINLCHTEARKTRTRRRHHEEAGGSPRLAPGPEELYQRQERAQLVLAALQALPEEQRTVIIMKEYEGLKFREIAEVLELPENTVKSRLYYGLRALRKFFLTTNLKREVYHE
jgi:RNA polymerase sigma-70 factor (ECF subfamily)